MEARVLIVEDEALIALHLEQLAIEAGHRVVGISFDLREAIEMAQGQRPDFAFVDMRLRNGASGLEVVRQLRQQYDTPSILVSGNLDAQAREAASAFRPIAMIGKPFLPASIVTAMALAVAEIEAQQASADPGPQLGKDRAG